MKKNQIALFCEGKESSLDYQIYDKLISDIAGNTTNITIIPLGSVRGSYKVVEGGAIREGEIFLDNHWTSKSGILPSEDVLASFEKCKLEGLKLLTNYHQKVNNASCELKFSHFEQSEKSHKVCSKDFFL